jgi:modification methylase
MLGRRFIGIERDADYAAIARERIDGVRPVTDIEFVTTPSKREEPRIPFGWLVERGMLRPGEVLTDPSGRWSARVRADGTLISSDHKGSIHQVGAAVQGAPACNGWTFWCVTVEGRRVPIDLLRQKLRAELN